MEIKQLKSKLNIKEEELAKLYQEQVKTLGNESGLEEEFEFDIWC